MTAGAADRGAGTAGAAEKQAAPALSGRWTRQNLVMPSGWELGAAGGLGLGHGWMDGWWGDAGKRCGVGESKWVMDPGGIQETVCPSSLELREKAHAGGDRFVGHQL